MSREFFAVVRERRQSAPFTALKIPNGNRVTDTKDLAQAITEFYTNLCAAHPTSTDQNVAEEQFLHKLPDRFSTNCQPSMLAELGAVPTKEELGNAIRVIARGRSPGPDGIIVEFYHQFWDMIADEFTRMLTTAIEQESLPSGMNKGLVVLLPKDGDRELLSNWRPITLLNTSYKIFAKSLQLRL